MTEPNAPSSPSMRTIDVLLENGSVAPELVSEGGLTKREHFAALANVDEGDWPDGIVEQVQFLGRQYPSMGTWAEQMQWRAELCAKVKTVKADALIAALNEQKD